MNWHYVVGEKQTGPVGDAEFESLILRKIITPATMVWREGMTDWKTLAEVRPSTTPPPAPDGVACAECGKIFPASDVINLNQSWVCAGCKPTFLQRLAEGVATAGKAGLWRQGKKLVTRSETPLPDRCIKCNAPANGFRLKRILYWQHPAYYLLFFCSLLILVIVILIVRKKAVLHIGLCEAHRQQRKTAIAVCTTGVLAGLAMIIGGAAANSGWLALAGAVVLLAGAIWGAVKGATIVATKIDKENVWVSGVNQDWLNELPEWKG